MSMVPFLVVEDGTGPRAVPMHSHRTLSKRETTSPPWHTRRVKPRATLAGAACCAALALAGSAPARAAVGASDATGLTTGLAAGSTGVPGAAVATGRLTILSDVFHPFPRLSPPVAAAFPGPRLRGYGFSAKVTGDECAPTVGSGIDELRSARGDVVCAFSLPTTVFGTESVTAAGEAVAPISGEVSDGTTAVAITLGDLYRSATTEFAVSVPARSDALVVLSSAGFDQSFSLTAGTHVGQAPVILYRSGSSYEVSSSPGTTVSLAERGVSDKVTASVKVSLSDFELTYFLPNDPLVRAPRADEAFLVASFGSTDEPGPSGASFADLAPLPGTDVRLRLSSDVVISSRPEGPETTGLVADSYVFVVPASFHRGSLVFRAATVHGYESRAQGGSPFSEPVRIGAGVIPIAGGVGVSKGTSRESTGTAAPARGARPNTPPYIPLVAGGGLVLIVLVLIVPIRRRRDRRRGSTVVIVFPQPGARQQPTADTSTPADAGGATAATTRASGAGAAESPPLVLRVKVLGPVEVAGYVATPRRRVCEELAVYLSLSEGHPVTADKLRAVFGGGVADLEAATLYNYVSELRRALGKDRLSREGRAGYRFVGELECDWTRFCQLAACAKTAKGGERVDLLSEALELVRGMPFAGVPPNSYRWAFDTQIASSMGNAIEHLAHELANELMVIGKERDAIGACCRGALGQPGSPVLAEDRMRAAANDPVAFEQACRDLGGVIEDFPHLQRLSDELRARRGGR